MRIGSRAIARIVANICVHGRHHERIFAGTNLKKELSAAEIYDTLYDIDPRTMRGVCRQNFGAELRSFGAKRRKHHERRVYGVMRGEG